MTQANPPNVDGVILVAPAVWARTTMPFYQRWILWLAAHTIPWKTVTGEILDIKASDNIEMLKELGQDPLVIKETRIDVLYGLSNLMDEGFRRGELYTMPSLILYGEKDEIIPKKPVLEFYKRLPAKVQNHQQMILYENGYHMLLRDLQADIVMKDIIDWIKDPTKPVSSLQNDLARKIDTNN
jgi:alpha-beta hydrolase superfamily lysophospholipase